ncbi:MAG: hypothetical protein IJ871_10270 [Ruminococcus sp.]|nr:hypothetical protein [Ruminococcus sp.]MBR2305497.1 hypothetical protein [Ruminococcus sp.]
MKYSTTDLLSVLKKTEEYDDFYIENNNDLLKENVGGMLNDMIRRRRLSKKQVIKDSQVNRVYAYQILSGAKSAPARDKLLCLLIAMKIPLDEVQTFLKTNGYPQLYPRIKRDSIIIFCINKGATVVETNYELFSHEEKPLL